MIWECRNKRTISRPKKCMDTSAQSLRSSRPITVVSSASSSSFRKRSNAMKLSISWTTSSSRSPSKKITTKASSRKRWVSKKTTNIHVCSWIRHQMWFPVPIRALSLTSLTFYANKISLATIGLTLRRKNKRFTTLKSTFLLWWTNCCSHSKGDSSFTPYPNTSNPSNWSGSSATTPETIRPRRANCSGIIWKTKSWRYFPSRKPSTNCTILSTIGKHDSMAKNTTVPTSLDLTHVISAFTQN